MAAAPAKKCGSEHPGLSGGAVPGKPSKLDAYFRCGMASWHASIPFIVAMAMPGTTRGQTFTGNGAVIPGEGSVLELNLDVAGLPPALNTGSYGLEQICITVDHSWIEGLALACVAPDGTTVLLTSGIGGSSDHYTNTCFAAGAELTIMQGSPPFTGTFRPMEDMAVINNGQDGNGTWKLRITDTSPPGNSGSVIAWSLSFGDEPAAPFSFQSSNLPIVVIDTDGQDIPSEGKIPATMGIVYNGIGSSNLPSGPYNEYNGPIGIEMHGSSSNTAPKKSYSFEFRDSFGEDLNAPILGMPAGSDWLLVANYFDKSLMNNTLAYHLGQAMGHYAPRHRNVEVVVNGTYVGVYVLVERIKRSAARLDLAKLDPDEISGDDVTGGYIISIDRNGGPGSGFASTFLPPAHEFGQEVFFRYRYPKAEAIVPEQEAYIQAYVDSFETALAGPGFTDPEDGYRAYADVNTFIDLFLLNELSRNVDSYRLSTYLHKDKNSRGGKLRAGPPWDYDLAWGNAYYCGGASTSGWAYQFGDACSFDDYQVPFWWGRFMEDSAFVEALHCRWTELRDNVLSPASISAYCDSVAAQLQEAQQRNFTAWPILGTYVWPNPEPVPLTYAGEVQELKDFVNARWAWLDGNMPGSWGCSTTGLADPGNILVTQPFPNPFSNALRLRPNGHAIIGAKLMDPLGRMVAQGNRPILPGETGTLPIPGHLAPGSYILVVTTKEGASSAFRVVHE